jgi:MFS family permease
LDYVENVSTFTYLCFAVRMAEALGSCAFSTASYVYIMHFFSDQLGWTFGVLETFVGLGMSLGPGIGGGLYGLGGYPLPFYLLGVFTLINFPFAWTVLPLLGDVMHDDDLPAKGAKQSSPATAQSGSSECFTIDWPTSDSPATLNKASWSLSSGSGTTSTSRDDYGSLSVEGPCSKGELGRLTYGKILRMPPVLLICLVVVVVSQSQGFLDPTIEPHLRMYGIQPHLVGLIFLLMSAAYALTSPVVGWWASRTADKVPIMALGCLITVVGLLLVGPSTITTFQPSIFFR